MRLTLQHTLRHTKRSSEVDFLIKYSGYFSNFQKDELEKELDIHELSKTLVREYHSKIGLIGLARWNWEGDKVIVLDCVVHPLFRGKDLLKRMLKEAKAKNPRMKKIAFQREKYNARTRVYDIDKFLGV